MEFQETYSRSIPGSSDNDTVYTTLSLILQFTVIEQCI